MADPQVKVRFTGDASGLEQAAKKADAALGQVKNSAGRATQTLVNISRVASDAPFGFIAIANNIEPLLQSLGDLSKVSGGAGGALKSLGAAMLGPTGIIVGFSIASGLIQSQILKYGSLGNALAALTSSNSAAAEAQREMNKTFSDSIGKAQGEIATLNALLKVARDETLTKQQRNNAIKEINEKYDEYLPKLNLETINTDKVRKATDDLSASLIRNAKVRGIQDLISKESAKQLELLTGTVEDNARWYDILASAVYGMNQAGRVHELGLKRRDEAIDKSKAKVEIFNKAIEDLIATETQFTKPGKEKISKIVEDQEKIRHAIMFSREELEAFQRTLDIVNGKLPQKKTAVTPTGEIAPSLRLPGSDAESKRAQERAKALEGLAKAAEMANVMIEQLGQSFTGLFENILQGGKNAFQQFAQAIAAVIRKLLSAAITAAIFAGIVSLATGGIGGGFIGNFKSIFSQLSGLPKFAEGGIARGPRSGYPVMLHGTEAVVPFDKMDQFINMVGGQQEKVVERYEISGDQLNLILERYQARRGRLG